MNSNIAEESESINSKKLASMIDHTILKADATTEQIGKICREAIEYRFASVCVNSCHVPLVAKLLKGSGVKVCSVIGFPLGAAATAAKAAETAEAIRSGTDEVDMVLNIGAARSGSYDVVFNDIKAVVNAARKKALVKVIIETCLLTDEEKVKVCEAAKAAGADFVKTSTGFSTGGATVEDVGLMRRTVGPDMGVKASGGIRNYETAIQMIKAGANRIGVSASIAIIKEAEARGL